MNNIKEYRKKKELSQESIAQELKTNQNTVSQWENDKRTPNARQAIKLAKILETTVEKLFK